MGTEETGEKDEEAKGGQDAGDRHGCHRVIEGTGFISLGYLLRAITRTLSKIHDFIIIHV
jgi:hypothetical protein